MTWYLTYSGVKESVILYCKNTLFYKNCIYQVNLFNGLIPFYEGDLDAMRDKLGKYRTLVVDIKEKNFNLTIENVVLIKENGPRKWLRFDKDDISPLEIIAELMKKYEVVDLTVEEPEIEGIIKQIYNGSGVRLNVMLHIIL